jgi:hypothetical protein
MVEETLRKQDGPISIEGLKRTLPKKNHGPILKNNSVLFRK